MSYVIINGNRYDIPEINFDAICELEENGVNLIGANSNNLKYATMARGLVAWIMKVDQHTASLELQEHLANGGSINEIFVKVTNAIYESGFFTQKNQKETQDHQRAQARSNTVPYPQNREQRRRNKNGKGNGDHTRK